MPDLGISELLTILSLAVGAGSTGVGLYESSKAQDAQKNALQQQQQAQAQAAARQALLQKQEAVLAAGPEAQAQTSGSLTGAAGSSFTDLLAGYGGQQGGQGGGATPQPSSSSTGSAAPPSPQDIIQQLLAARDSGNWSGGGGGNPNPYSGRLNLAQLNLGG